MPGTATNRLSVLFVLLLLLFPFKSIAQNEKASLYSIILKLEREHEILFSYVIEEVQDYTLSPPSEAFSLEETLEYLNQETPFIFKKINDRYYTISKDPGAVKIVCAILLDANSGLPLANASINSSSGQNTVTDTSGKFQLEYTGTFETIRIQFLGYENLTIENSEMGSECPNILINPIVSQLNEVLISGFLIKGIDRRIDGSTSLKTQNFGLLPGQTENDILQIAQSLPGVESINETISTINIRGGTNDENLILWEGIRMYQIGHFFGLISAFDPNLTSDVAIYKNGTPAQYGESVSGVIAMASKNSVPTEFHGGIGANLISTNAFLEVPVTKNLGIQLSGRTSINGVFESPVYNSFSDRVFQDTEISNNQNSDDFTQVLFKEDFYFFDVGGKLLWDPTSKDRIRMNFISMENHFEFSESLELRSETSKLEQKSQAGGLQWNHQWNSQFSTTFSAHATHYLLDAINRDIFTDQVINQENEVLDLGASLQAKYIFSNKLNLVGGYQFLEVGVSNTQDVNLPRFRDYEKDVLRSHIGHLNLHFESKEKTTRADVGVRGNYFDKYSMIVVEPRLYFYQSLTNGFALEVAGEMKSQTLTQRIDLQSDFLGIEKRRWVLANEEDIPVKIGRQISLGLLYNQKGWFINLEGFYKNVSDIYSKSQGFQNQFQFKSAVGDYSVKGLEFTVNKKINNLSTWISYSYGKNDFKFDDFTPTEFPNNLDIRHTVNIASSYEWNNFKFALGLNWRTGKPYTIPKAGAPYIIGDGFLEIDFEEPNNNRVDDYFRVDFSSEYIWHINERLDAKFNLGLLNVTSEENSLNIRYALEDSSSFSSDINRIEELSLGFTPNFAVQLLF